MSKRKRISFSRNWIRAIFPLLLLLQSQLTFSGETINVRDSVSYKLIQLALDGEFTALEDSFLREQKRFRNGEVAEYTFLKNYTAFANSHPQLRVPIDLWVESYPQSFHARVSRGNYLQAVAVLLRGAGSIGETSDGQILDMQALLDISESDFLKAAELDSKSALPYGFLINLYSLSGASEKLQDAVEQGLLRDSASYLVRSNLLEALRPEWGGSFEAMDELVKDSKQHHSQNPDLQFLEPYLYGAYATTLSRQRKYEDALQVAREVVEVEPDAFTILRMGMVAYYSGDLPLADKWINQSISTSSGFLQQYFWKGRVAYKKNNFDSAIHWFNQALQLNPANTDTLYWKSIALEELKRYDESEQAIQTAIGHYGSENIDILNRGIRLISFIKKDHKRAVAFAEKHQSKLINRSGIFWYFYGDSLAKLQDCKTVAAMKTYLKECRDATNSCRKDAMQKADQQIDALLNPKRCPDLPAFGD